MRIIYGPDSSALAQAVVEAVIRQTKDWPERRALVLVPEDRKLSFEQQFLARQPQTGLFMTEVLSFTRLAFRLADAVKATGKLAPSATEQLLLLSAILNGHEADFPILGRLSQRPAYFQELQNLLGFLQRYDVTSSDLETAQLARDQLPQSLRAKCRDLALLQRRYQESLQRLGLAEPGQALNELGRLLEQYATGQLDPLLSQQLSFLEQLSVWVCGFGELRDFTPQEYRILAWLEKLSDQLNVTVLTDQLPNTAATLSLTDPAFYFGALTGRHLAQNYKISQTVYAAPAVRPGPSLKSGLTMAPFAGLQAPQRREELRAVLAQIKSLVLQQRCRYKDIGLYLAAPQAYLPYLQAELAAYKIPAFLDQPRHPEQSAIIRLLLALIDLAQYNWQSDAVMALLHSGVLAQVQREKADDFENFMLAHGLDHELLFHDPAYEDCSELLLLRRQTLDPLKPGIQALRRAATVQDKTACIRQLLAELDAETWCRELVLNLRRQGESDLAVTQAQAWQSLGRILTQLETILPQQPLSLAAFTELILTVLAAELTTIIPTELDQVVIGQGRRFMGQSFACLFIVGADRQSFPAQAAPGALLKGEETKLLSRVLQRPLPSLEQTRPQEDRVLELQLQLAARQRLFISWTGETADMCALLQRLYALSPGQPLTQLSAAAESPDDLRLMSEAVLRYRLLLRQSSKRPARPSARLSDLPARLGEAEKGVTAESQTYWDCLKAALSRQQQNSRSQAAQAKSRPEPEYAGVFPGAEIQLPPALMTAYWRGGLLLSVSQLEQYAACPFAYFARYILQAKERDLFEPAAPDRGSALHAMLEISYSYLEDLLRQAAQDQESSPAAVWQRFLASPYADPEELYRLALARQQQLRRFDAPGYRLARGHLLKKTASLIFPLTWQLAQASSFVPLYSEWQFGLGKADAAPAYELWLNDHQKLRLGGSIDRVDADFAQGRFQIWDYKTGAVTVNYEDLYGGTNLQLLTYLDAFANQRSAGAGYPLQTGAGEQPAVKLQPYDAAYLPVRPINISHPFEPSADPREIFRESLHKAFKASAISLPPDELQRLLMHNRQNLRQLGRQLISGSYEVRPDTAGKTTSPCVYCAYRSSCGMESGITFDKRPERLLPEYDADGQKLSKSKDRLLAALRAEDGNQPEPAGKDDRL
ncbi:MAG: PD-(D/E)XK nuclease family protein [Oscillospiraceae bacterium]|nr:PD-(D/E)XK nuclease family protein [Oscillospiraceae bacterium]MDD4367737.1 PD-(D/E)XK nuclease family protein [Oscillospiraceae bacterium]